MKTTSRGSLEKKRVRRRSTSLRQASLAAERRLVLDAAAALLTERGADGLNVRDIGAAVGASSTIVYKLFGGREQLLAALYEDGLARLGEEMAKVKGPDPFTHLIQLALAYRRFARANPNFYNAFGAVPGPARPPMPLRQSLAYRVLREGVVDAIAAGVFAPGDPDLIADALWSSVHGNIDLELAGYFPNPEMSDARFFLVGLAVMNSLRAK